MKQYDVEHGSEDWHKLRLGIPTSSEFHKIMTPKTRKMSSQHKKFAISKVAEIMTGLPQGIIKPTYAMERGKLMEAEAVSAYEFQYDVRIQKAGFITDDKGHYGCSPDAESINGERVCYEIKCYEEAHHLEYLINPEIDSDHMPQIQGQLWLGEYDYAVNWLYHPILPSHRIIIERDESYISDMKICLGEFRDTMNDIIEKLQANGNWVVPEIQPNERFDPAEYLRN